MKKKMLCLLFLMCIFFVTQSVHAQAASVLCSWSAVTTNVSGDTITGVTYNLYRSPNADMSSKIKLNATTPITSVSFTDTTAPSATNIYYQVHAVSSSGVEGAGSTILKFNTNDRIPSVPGAFTVK